MTYKNSDYTTMITVVPWPKRLFLVLKLTLVLELWVLLSYGWSPLLKRLIRFSLAVQLSGKAHDNSDYTAMNAVVHWHLRRCRNSPWWQGCECCNNFVFLLAAIAAIAWLKQHGHHVLIGMRCKLTTYIIWSAFALNEAWIWAGGCKQSLPRYLQHQSRTCYQKAVATWSI